MILVRALALLLVVLPHYLLAQPLTITTLAGPPHERGFEDGMNGAAGFANPSGLGTDSGGNVYVADRGNETIRKISPTGDVTTLAGLARSSGTADGRGSAARFHSPDDVATDATGNVYVCSSNSIRRITPAGVVTRLAGPPFALVGSADGTGSEARFNSPRGLTVDRLGNVYVADTDNHTIRKITPAGVVTTLAGLAGNNGSADGTGSAARFHFPHDVATGGDGNLYVADRDNHTIRRITLTGAVTTFAGVSGARGNADGTGSAARFAEPLSVAAGPDGDLFVVNEHGIRKISPAAEVTTLAGDAYSGIAPPLTRFRTLSAVAVDESGNVFAADISTIWKVTPDGKASTLAGWNIGHEDGPARIARFWSPAAAAVDSNGAVYVTDSANNTIRTISPLGDVTTLAGLAEVGGSADGTGSAARFQGLTGITTDGNGNLYVTDDGNNTIRKVTAAGVVTTMAGKAGVSPGYRDGKAAEARFNSPTALVLDDARNLYVVDPNNQAIRKISAAGDVTTLAGGPGVGSADGIGALAEFNYPTGIAIASDGDLYVTDMYNRTIRRITPAGVVTTYAGQAGSPGSSDGTGSTARFTFPAHIVSDRSGDLLVSDGETIRRIRPGGVVTTVAGVMGACRSADGTGSAAWFCGAGGMAADAGGNVYMADVANATIRVGTAVIDDAAIIDQVAGPVGIARLLSTAPQTATSWQWILIRRPSGSSAQLSSTAIANPTFTPDVADLYQFRLVARGSMGTSVTVVSLQATPAPRRRSVQH